VLKKRGLGSGYDHRTGLGTGFVAGQCTSLLNLMYIPEGSFLGHSTV